ncbi:MAG: hypothetical protein Q8K75_12400 [Chlamydiales bacterium]|nr:hypothetical protein [Chlamydiales bacterium]
MSLKENTIYMGEFQNDQYHGNGVSYLSDGARHKGTFVNGLLDGKGEISNANRFNAIRHGGGVHRAQDGTFIQVQYNMGNLVQNN